ncbi:MAG: YebC/PmpR family DNA-binding transcriptional regulator, partial [Patescibacteria group bacterium]
ANMPKVNIEKAVSRGGTGEKLSEVSYEGFGPGNISVIVEAATDNRNRTAQEIKGLFEHGGGRLGGPGSVSYNFETKGLMVVEKGSDIDDQMLKLIDLGVEEVEETDDGIEIYTEPSKLSETRDKVDKLGFMVTSYELTQKPKTLQTVSDKSKASKLVTFLEKLESHDDVQKVFANLDVPDDVLGNIS